MKNVSHTAMALILIGVMSVFFSTVSYAFTPIDNTSEAVHAYGFTPTATRTAGARSTGGGRPPSIPEPTTLILTGLGLSGLAGYVVRRHKNKPPDQ